MLVSTLQPRPLKRDGGSPELPVLPDAEYRQRRHYPVWSWIYPHTVLCSSHATEGVLDPGSVSLAPLHLCSSCIAACLAEDLAHQSWTRSPGRKGGNIPMYLLEFGVLTRGTRRTKDRVNQLDKPALCQHRRGIATARSSPRYHCSLARDARGVPTRDYPIRIPFHNTILRMAPGQASWARRSQARHGLSGETHVSGDAGDGLHRDNQEWRPHGLELKRYRATVSARLPPPALWADPRPFPRPSTGPLGSGDVIAQQPGMLSGALLKSPARDAMRRLGNPSR